MAPVPTQSKRLDALETRVMHQDQTIEDLNATITAQWRQIDRLSHLIQRLDEKLNELNAAGPNPSERPPPHY